MEATRKKRQSSIRPRRNPKRVPARVSKPPTSRFYQLKTGRNTSSGRRTGPTLSEIRTRERPFENSPTSEFTGERSQRHTPLARDEPNWRQ